MQKYFIYCLLNRLNRVASVTTLGYIFCYQNITQGSIERYKLKLNTSYIPITFTQSISILETRSVPLIKEEKKSVLNYL